VLHNHISTVQFPVKARDFSLSKASRSPLGPNNLLSRGFFQPGPEVDFSVPSNARIKTAYCVAMHTLRHTSSWRFTDEQAQYAYLECLYYYYYYYYYYSLSPLCRVFTVTYLKQTMFSGYIQLVLQLFCVYSLCCT
jgi:hypothetical protein